MLQEHAAIIAEEFNVTKRHATALLRLLDDGATVPFISRYRKEATGDMNETTVRNIQLRHQALTELDDRKATILKTIKEQDQLTPELRERIEQCVSATVLDDIYQPYRPKRKTRAAAAYELGLEPLARLIRGMDLADPEAEAARFVGKGKAGSVEEALAGAVDIISEQVASDEKARNLVRSKYLRNGEVVSKIARNASAEEAKQYQNYFDFSEPVRTANSHRYLAMRRGEDEGLLRVSINIDDTDMTERLTRMFVRSTATEACAALMRQAVAEGYRRLLRPAIETEIAASLKERADSAAISVFADNVEQLLMMPPLGPGHRVLAIDPGFKSGCKIAVLDQKGDLVASDIIYPNAPANDYYNATEALCFLVDRYGIDTIAIGNGTAGRETERFVCGLQLPRRVSVHMVNEDGASVYSASEVAVAEMPDIDVTIRGAVSIGRRLIDPLSELVKIDPKAIGVGQYQHDVNQPRLRDALAYTVEKCVNAVGVNLNTASAKLLSYVSGIGPGLAENIVKYRAENGPFTSRDALMEVPRMGVKTFQQCAGFLRIPESENLLDNTGIHPENYPLVWQIATDMNVPVERLARNRNLLGQIDLDHYTNRHLGMATLKLIVGELESPGRDIRVTEEQKSPVQAADSGTRTIADLHIGQELTGKVNNITDFGVFVDLGIKENGLIHISQLSDEFVQSAHQVVRIGQTVNVRIIDIDVRRGRIALTMKS